jgi:hypothetical protein
MVIHAVSFVEKFLWESKKSDFYNKSSLPSQLVILLVARTSE